jgi:LPXTG-site transpeptidase (sortase) family protein
MEDQHESLIEKKKFTSFLKWSFFIFFILLVLSVSLGLSPLGVRELNNYFFSLFINDARTSENAPTSIAKPAVSLSLDSMQTNRVESAPASSKPTVTVSETSPAPQPAPKPTTVASNAVSSDPYNPVRVVSAKVGLDAVVHNPVSTNLASLDNQLLYGAVRYAESGNLESNKNILIFGHSSQLPKVYNQNFKIFNGVKRLAAGDEILVYSKTHVYRYVVTSLTLVRASEGVVTFSNEHKLVLVTCNVAGAKEERFMAEADFVGSYPIIG